MSRPSQFPKLGAGQLCALRLYSTFNHNVPSIICFCFSRVAFLHSVTSPDFIMLCNVIHRLAYSAAVGSEESPDARATHFDNSFTSTFPSSVCIAPGIGGIAGHLSLVKTVCLINSICHINSNACNSLSKTIGHFVNSSKFPALTLICWGRADDWL